jgi:hypothetical protein
MYPNSALAAWQLALMLVVPLASLAVWLTAVFLARDDQERQDKLAA